MADRDPPAIVAINAWLADFAAARQLDFIEVGKSGETAMRRQWRACAGDLE